MKARKQKTIRARNRRGILDKLKGLSRIIDVAYKFVTILTILVKFIE